MNLIPKDLIFRFTNVATEYTSTDKVKFNVFVIDRLAEQKVYKTPFSLKSISLSKVYYRVRDPDTGTIIIPFKDNDSNSATRLSSNSAGMAFNFRMESLFPGRSYVFDLLIKDYDINRIYEGVSGKFRVVLMARDYNPIYQGGLFSPKIMKGLRDGTGTITDITSLSISGSAIASTSSFRFDLPGTALKSTQQIPVDWSDYTQHTFFNSAEAKVNTAFDSIINYFPFDGTKKEQDEFFDNLTGYEKYIYDTFPKHIGFLFFSGGLESYISVTDRAGSLYPALSRDDSGKIILAPVINLFLVECFLHVPSQSCENQVITQKLSTSNNHGFSLFLSKSSTVKTDLVFAVTSGSNILITSASLDKGGFRHIAAVYDKNYSPLPKLKLFVSGTLVSTSSLTSDFGNFNFGTSNLNIGSGSVHELGIFSSANIKDKKFTPQETLSGAIDNFKFWHTSLKSKEIKANMYKASYSQPKLALYFKFNEATGSYPNNSIILDSSGNSLHSKVTNFAASLRDPLFLQNPILLEKKSLNPILFPGNDGVTNLNTTLLAEAKQYDGNNPNLITNLIPKHYLIDQSLIEGYGKAELGNTGADYSYNTDFPGGGKIGSPQIISALLFTWAKFFDTIKLFIDHFGRLLKIEYDSELTISDHLLPFFANYYGFILPNNFNMASFDQYESGDNLTENIGVSKLSLKKVQNEIWRRILVNFSEIIKSKGTVHSIKALLRASGINPDNNFRFREFGGSKTLTTTDARRKLQEVSTLLEMSGSTSYVQSPFLSGSRIEVGFPTPSGAFVKKGQYEPHGISNAARDGLFTSGSFTFEAVYKFVGLSQNNPLTQSLVRILSTGSAAPGLKGTLLANLVAYGTGSLFFQTGSLRLFSRPSTSATAPLINLELTGANVFDGDKWHVSFGRIVGNSTSSFATSSYFLRAGKQNHGRLSEYYYTSSFSAEGTPSTNLFSNLSTTYNSSGSFFQIGSGTLGTSANAFLNATTKVTDNNARATNFKGKVGHIRFWSNGLTVDEDKEHTKNFKSMGVIDPKIHFNFVTKQTGSFERMRVNATTDQIHTKSNASGQLTVFDFSQNNLHLTGSGFPASNEIIKPELFSFSILDPKFDERNAENKIRIRGFQETINIKEFNTLKSPVRNIPEYEKITDDTRFSIEISAVRALNEDMMSLLSSLDFYDNAIGNPELVFSDAYPSLTALRDVYFNRLEKKVNFKNLFEFYKWFDDSLGIMIERLIPRTTKFLGINFIVESHALERAKMRYLFSDIYLGENDRRGLQTDILLRVLDIMIRKG